jgi:hypothetical protein
MDYIQYPPDVYEGWLSPRQVQPMRAVAEDRVEQRLRAHGRVGASAAAQLTATSPIRARIIKERRCQPHNSNIDKYSYNKISRRWLLNWVSIECIFSYSHQFY